MTQLKIASGLKLLGLLSVSAVIFLAGLGFAMVGDMVTVADRMYSRGLVGSKLLADANNAVWELRFGIANYTLASPDNRRAIIAGRPALYAAFETSTAQYAALGAVSQQDPTLKAMLDAFVAYKAGAPTWFELIDADKMAEAADYRAKVTNAAGSAMVKNIKQLIDNQLAINEALEKESKATAERGQMLLLAIGGAVFLVVAALVWLLARTISRSLREFQSGIESIERESDFTRRVSVVGSNEIAATAASFNQLVATFQSSLHELIERVEKVSRAAGSLSASSVRVAAGAAEQSEATSSMAATVEEVTVSINTVSGNAQSAMALSTSSDELADRGRAVIQKTVSEVLEIAGTMRRTADVIVKLGEQSSRISSVVQVIKEVADQTNLLALNAAIEAARAGEQGRGFAVVADEVRKLAERTTQSTQEITAMIAAIQGSAQEAVASMSAAVSQMDGGVVLARQAGDSINDIRERANHMTRVVGDIASALDEQSAASNELAQLVENVARMTEANSTASTEISQATDRLVRLADEMRTVGSQFRT